MKLRNKIMLPACLLALVIFAGTLGIIVTRMGGEIQKEAKSMSEGDFTQRQEIKQKDEVGVLAGALNTMVEKLEEVARSGRPPTMWLPDQKR